MSITVFMIKNKKISDFFSRPYKKGVIFVAEGGGFVYRLHMKIVFFTEE